MGQRVYCACDSYSDTDPLDVVTPPDNIHPRCGYVYGSAGCDMECA